jgi:2-polyprenyl-3-methyl-5-hydroxy-6-metoxy-1,4-benzoquinol methylase
MSNTIHYSSCPVCNSNAITPALTAKDYTVSKQEFSIWQCSNCSLRFTQDVPDETGIPVYYQSEEYISHSDTGKGLINKLYHLVRKRTLSGKRKLIEKYTGLKRGNMLDIGSGTGAFINEMQQAGWAITGLEPDTGARTRASILYKLSLKDSAELFSLSPASFDAVTLWHVLEHVHELNEYVLHLKTLLRPGGKLFIAVPNYRSYDARVYKECWAAYDVPRHLYHFSPQSMKALVEKHGLKITSCKPMWYDSFYISLLSSKYKNGRSNFIHAGWTGFVSNLKALFDTGRCSSVIYIISSKD